MASGSKLRKSSSSSKTTLLARVDLRTLMNKSPDLNPTCPSRRIDLAALRTWERKAINLSRRLIPDVVVNWRRKKEQQEEKRGDVVEGEESGTSSASGCLVFLVKGGACRVGSCEEFETDQRRKPLEFELRCPLRVADGGGLECLPHGVSEMFWRMSSRKGKEIEQPRSCSANVQSRLPDDVLEMCLVRLPLTSLMTARLVCRKWNSLTTTAHFMRMRSEGSYQSPWLFLFGIMKNSAYVGEIYALDVSLDRWHKIIAPTLHGRFLFSVASIRSDIYVVGGCSSFNRHGPMAGGSSVKTHKGVSVFSPLNGSWFKAASMKFARSAAVLGVFEVASSYAVPHGQSGGRQEGRQRGSRVRGVSDVYEDPHRCSVRRRPETACPGTDGSHMFNESRFEPSKGGEKRPLLIVVGGRGSWDEPLDSGEIYDPFTNKWTQITKLPVDFGTACSGAACGGVFYVYSGTDKLAGYDLRNDIWVAIQTSQIPPCIREYHPKLVSCNNRLFMVSVSWSDRDLQLNRRERAVRKLWELDPVLCSWAEASRHPDAPMDRIAAFVANGNDIYGVEMFKIFGQVLDFITVCNVSGMELAWSRISRQHATHEADASSCVAKTVAALQL